MIWASDAGSETYALLGVVPGDSLYDMIHTYGFDMHYTAPPKVTA